MQKSHLSIRPESGLDKISLGLPRDETIHWLVESGIGFVADQDILIDLVNMAVKLRFDGDGKLLIQIRLLDDMI